MKFIKILNKILFKNNHEDKAPVKDLDYLAIHYPYEYNTVCGVYNILENDIDETEKCLLFSQWLLFDPVWMAERTNSEVIDVVVHYYNSVTLDDIKNMYKYVPLHNTSEVLGFVELMRGK